MDIRLPPPQEVRLEKFQREVSKDLLDDEQILKDYEAKSKQALIKDQLSLVQQETWGLNDTIDDREIMCNFKNDNQENLLVLDEEPEYNEIEIIHSRRVKQSEPTSAQKARRTRSSRKSSTVGNPETEKKIASYLHRLSDKNSKETRNVGVMGDRTNLSRQSSNTQLS